MNRIAIHNTRVLRAGYMLEEPIRRDEMDEKEYEHMQESFLPGVVSDCCDAPICGTDICSECREHCEPIDGE